MKIILTMALYNYKVLVIIKKNSHSVLVNHGKTLKTFFQDFPGLTNKIQELSRTFQDSKRNPGLFQDVATLFIMQYNRANYRVNISNKGQSSIKDNQ